MVKNFCALFNFLEEGYTLFKFVVVCILGKEAHKKRHSGFGSESKALYAVFADFVTQKCRIAAWRPQWRKAKPISESSVLFVLKIVVSGLHHQK
jgi:hypothetical protein